ncbi:DUF3999 domain-containing protein [Pseudomonas fluvialis]|nr:DUF3999 domain-containing protein [Pseudomonas fluvialis]
MALLLVLATPVLAVEKAEDFAWQATLQTPVAGPWFQLDLPLPALLAAKHSDLRDLRVQNAQGQFLAYSLLQPAAEYRQAEQSHGVRWFPLQAEQAATGLPPGLRIESSSTGTLVEVQPATAPSSQPLPRQGWLLDASAIQAPLVRLSLDWDGAEGFQRFAVEGSDDLQHWQAVGDYQVARLSFAGDRIEQREIRLPALRSRYLRLLWRSPALAPELTAVQLVSVQEGYVEPPLLWSEPLPAHQLDAQSYQWQLPRALPVQALRLPLSDANSLVPVRVQGRVDTTRPWGAVAQGVLYRLPQQGREVREEELRLPGWPLSELRVQVDARGGGFSSAPQLQYALSGQRLVFLARGEGPYRLLLGNAKAAPVELPLATLMPGYSSEPLRELPKASLLLPAEPSPQEQNQAGTITKEPRADWQRLALWAVLLAGVLLLGLMAYSLLRPRKPV